MVFDPEIFLIQQFYKYKLYYIMVQNKLIVVSKFNREKNKKKIRNREIKLKTGYPKKN